MKSMVRRIIRLAGMQQLGVRTEAQQVAYPPTQQAPSLSALTKSLKIPLAAAVDVIKFKLDALSAQKTSGINNNCQLPIVAALNEQ
jgi:hypothetical protein